MEEKYVYVIYDPMYEKVVCVHDQPGKECEVCKPIQKGRDVLYRLEEYKHIVETKLK